MEGTKAQMVVGWMAVSSRRSPAEIFTIKLTVIRRVKINGIGGGVFVAVKCSVPYIQLKPKVPVNYYEYRWFPLPAARHRRYNCREVKGKLEYYFKPVPK